MNIYVGSLAFEVTEDELRKEFEAYGTVSSASVIKDKFTGESRGFGFVEMPNNEEGKAALEALNGKDLKGRNLRVDEARPRDDSRKGGGGGGGGNRRY
ncbi:MAG: RNA-binding protein [Pseudomonadota bacterium]